MKDFQDHHGAIHHRTADLDFEIARLRGRDFVIDQQHVGLADRFMHFRLGRLLGARHAAAGRTLGGAVGGVQFRFGRAFEEAAHFLALANADIPRHVELHARLLEGAHHLVAEGAGEILQLGQRRLEVGFTELRQMHRREDGALRDFGGSRVVGRFDFDGHRGGTLQMMNDKRVKGSNRRAVGPLNRGAQPYARPLERAAAPRSLTSLISSRWPMARA